MSSPADAPTAGMEIRPITYQGRTVAACTREFFLSDEIDALHPGDPALSLVLAMVLYARDIAYGNQPGPYRDANTIPHPRRVLIPAELLDRPTIDAAAAAAWLTIPLHELHAAHTEHDAQLIADWLISPT